MKGHFPPSNQLRKKPWHFVLFIAVLYISMNELRYQRIYVLIAERVAEVLNYPSSNAPPKTNLPTRTDWNYFKTPSYCREILANPKIYSHCERDPVTKICPNKTAEMFSQYFQDYYLYLRHFSKLRRRGVYVDLASNHPFWISNSFFMDTCLGWDGICIEPHPHYTKLLREERNCLVVPKCVSNREGHKISFIVNEGLSGATETNKYFKQWQKEGKKYDQIPMTCVTLRNTFQKNRVTRIDYMSLDVEGHEILVLEGINWNKVMINVITVELSNEAGKQIEEFLTRKGYSRHVPDYDEQTKQTGLLREDGIFLRKGVVFGAPV